MNKIYNTVSSSSQTPAGKIKCVRNPNAYVLVFFLVCLAAVATWIIPAGRYNRVVQDGISLVVPNTFVNLPRQGQLPHKVFTAIFQGFVDKSSLIFMIFMVGATFRIWETTGAPGTLCKELARRFKGREYILVFIVMAALSLLGAVGVFGNIVPVLVPLGIFLATAMGYERGLGLLIVILGCFSGFNVGWGNAGILGLAEKIAGLPRFSATEMRLLIHLVNFLLCYGFVLFYMRTIKKNPERSLSYATNASLDCEIPTQCMTHRCRFNLIIMGLGLSAIIAGVVIWHWEIDEMASAFLFLGILISLLEGNGITGTANLCIDAWKHLLKASFIVGIAGGFVVILRDGGILDSLLFHLTDHVNELNPQLAVNALLTSNIILGSFVTSGSGLASAIMPIMVPIVDQLEISRQIAVQIFIFGDGFTNIMMPWIGSLISCLALANIGYGKYLKRIFPLFLTQIALSYLCINLMQLFAWAG